MHKQKLIFILFCLIVEINSVEDDLLNCSSHEAIGNLHEKQDTSSVVVARLYDSGNLPIFLQKQRRYKISQSRLREIRSDLLYPFRDTGDTHGSGDYQRDLHASNAQILKNFNFTLPFFGINYDYIRVSMNGFLEFSDPPPHYTYPLIFPTKDWPKRNDPAFIGIFHSKCRIGDVNLRDKDQRTPGVYFR